MLWVGSKDRNLIWSHLQWRKRKKIIYNEGEKKKDWILLLWQDTIWWRSINVAHVILIVRSGWTLTRKRYGQKAKPIMKWSRLRNAFQRIHVLSASLDNDYLEWQVLCVLKGQIPWFSAIANFTVFWDFTQSFLMNAKSESAEISSIKLEISEKEFYFKYLKNNDLLAYFFVLSCIKPCFPQVSVFYPIFVFSILWKTCHSIITLKKLPILHLGGVKRLGIRRPCSRMQKHTYQNPNFMIVKCMLYR